MPRATRNSMATPITSATSSPNIAVNTPAFTPPAISSAAEQVSTTPSAVQQTPTISQASQSVAAGLPSQLVASSSGRSLGLHPTLTTQTTSGRAISDAPAFLPTFGPPSSSILPGFVSTDTASSVISPTPLVSYTTAMPGIAPTSLSSSLSVLDLPSCKPSTTPFVVGPGFIPIPPKLVQTIVGGQFVDLPTLIQESCDEEPTTCTLLDGQLITDIVTWVQAFSIYSSIFCAHHPQRARDLWLYQLFIIRLAKQFHGLTWANYDKAFRRDAAARNITDWSQMNVELFNFHSAASHVDFAGQPRRTSTEARGSPSSQLCRSWNKGHCSCTLPRCRYRHACDVPGCLREHRAIHHPHRSTGGTTYENRAAKRFR